MKKKLLSLVLAGAMVATTSVSAFAADTTVPTKETTIESHENDKEVEIGITGNVVDNQGNTAPGTINVTVPTATTFTVASDGTLSSPNMVITNNSTESIKVKASRFEDSNGEENINVIKKTKFEEGGHTEADNNRGTVWLRLKGATNNLGLTSEEKGKMYDNDYNDEKTDASGYVLGKINSQGTMTLTLEGKGGVTPTDKYPVSKAIQDKFKLVLKIARDR